ncbi:TonB-dependent receptor [Colwellia psychrerythraea]|uniref:TonB-dependent receptor plug n=1 Tax=Colwellia psychrerythraea TaxID=28229 RepID=A0A099L679_COLPS|nr:TonB-dependent receptor [Colwellia psychrerythraea]KGJ97403.1 TonB-dependent receptor plug [Colwellia psychrerythraea]
MKLSLVASAISAGLLFSNTVSAYADTQVVADEEQQIERIIVTGQKIARTLQETTTSVAVITSEQFEQQNIKNFADALTFTANTYATPSNGFSIRGINGENVSGGGNSYLASVYVDGAALPRQMISGGGFSTWDAQQVEILRGPQSTLQGRNALAGAVILNTQKPTDEWQGIYRLQGGEYGEKEAAVAFGGGIIEEQLAFRLSGEHKEIDGFNTNITRNESSDYKEDDTYRLKVLLTPDAIPDLEMQLSYTHAKHTRGTFGVYEAETGSPYDQRYTNNNDKQEQFYDADLISLAVDYELNDEWSLTAVTAYSAVNSGYDWDGDNGPEDLGTRLYDTDIDNLSQELRFNFDYENLQGIIGAYYSNEKLNTAVSGTSYTSLASVGLDSQFLQNSYGLDAGTADLVMSQYNAFDPVSYLNTSTTESEVTSYAIFTDFVYQITEQWDIYAGLRWDHEKQQNAGDAKLTLLNGQLMPDPASYQGTPYQGIIPLVTGLNQYILGTVQQASNTSPLVDADFNTLLPKIGASYHWSEDLTTSFTFQKGYRSGGVGTNDARATTFQYDAEYTDNYELSLRSSWLDGALIANANIFYVDWKDQQVVAQLSENTFDTQTSNAAKSTVKGFEVEVNYQFNNQLKFYSALGQAKSEFIDYILEIPGQDKIDLSGRSFEESPEWTATVGGTYVADNGFFADVNANYASDTLADINPYARGLNEDDENFDKNNDSRTLVNMQLGYEWQQIGVYLIGKNIFDEEYIATRQTHYITLGNPRQVSLSVRGSF